jgi:hypothetical protein
MRWLAFFSPLGFLVLAAMGVVKQRVCHLSVRIFPGHSLGRFDAQSVVFFVLCPNEGAAARRWDVP